MNEEQSFHWCSLKYQYVQIRIKQHMCCCISFRSVVAFVLLSVCFFKIYEEGCNHIGHEKPVFTHLGLRQKLLEDKRTLRMSLWFSKDLCGPANIMALTGGGCDCEGQ